MKKRVVLYISQRSQLGPWKRAVLLALLQGPIIWLSKGLFKIWGIGSFLSDKMVLFLFCVYRCYQIGTLSVSDNAQIIILIAVFDVPLWWWFPAILHCMIVRKWRQPGLLTQKVYAPARMGPWNLGNDAIQWVMVVEKLHNPKQELHQTS